MTKWECQQRERNYEKRAKQTNKKNYEKRAKQKFLEQKS